MILRLFNNVSIVNISNPGYITLYSIKYTMIKFVDLNFRLQSVCLFVSQINSLFIQKQSLADVRKSDINFRLKDPLYLGTFKEKSRFVTF